MQHFHSDRYDLDAEAIQWTGGNLDEVRSHLGDRVEVVDGVLWLLAGPPGEHLGVPVEAGQWLAYLAGDPATADVRAVDGALLLSAYQPTT